MSDEDKNLFNVVGDAFDVVNKKTGIYNLNNIFEISKNHITVKIIT